MHVRNERVLIDLATRESMIENEGRGKGMIPAIDISIKELKTETILEGESCMICLEVKRRRIGWINIIDVEVCIYTRRFEIFFYKLGISLPYSRLSSYKSGITIGKELQYEN